MSRLYFLMTVILTVGVGNGSSAAADAAGTPLSSEQAVLRGTVYALEVDDNRLFLTSRDLEAGSRQVKREELQFAASHSNRPVELSLGVMGKKNLMAVVKVRRNDGYDFHCLTFIFRSSTEAAEREFTFFQSKFYASKQNLKILGISGRHAEGSALVVLGEVPSSKPATDGVIYFSGCPWPPSDGTLLHYRAQRTIEAGAE